MSIQKRSTLKNWFRKGLTPTQAQFADAFDSFFHKNEDLIPLNIVQGLTAALETKKNELQQYLNSKLNEAIDELDGRVNDNSETTVSVITFGGILTDSDIDVHEESYVGSVDVANIFWSTDVDCFVLRGTPPGVISPVYYMNFDGRDKYSDNDFQPYKGKWYQDINTEDYYYHLDSFNGLKIFEPKVSDMEKSVMWFNGVGQFTVQQTGISETGSWENVVYDLDSDKFVYKKVTSSGGVETITYYDTWLNETLYNDSTTRMPRKGVMFFNAANCRFYNLSAQRTLDELNSGPTIEQYNDLVRTVGEKEQRMGVASISTLEQTSVQLSLNLYHDFRNAVGVLDVHLPTTGIGRNVASCVLHLTTDSAPAISFYFTSVEDAHISYQEGFAIEANSEYEISCLWNGGHWFIAAMKIAASASTNSNNE